MDEILLQEIAKFVRRDGFFILDEIYQGLVHETGSYSSGLAVQTIFRDKQLLFFGMTGWRLGWVVIPSSAAGFLKIGPEPDHFTKLRSVRGLPHFQRNMTIHAERAEFFRSGRRNSV